MNIDCREFQERWLAAAGDAAAGLEPELARHLDACGVCGQFAQRSKRLVRALVELERLSVPTALDGRVVAALNAGHREDRAASAMRRLTRLDAPAEVGRGVADPRLLPGARAPRVLDRLVAEELADQPKAMARRFTSRLDRLEAPSALRERLAHGDAGTSWFAAARRRRVLLAAAVLAALLVIGGGAWVLERRAYRAEEFEVRYVVSLDELDPVTRGFLAGLSGGLSEVKGTTTDAGPGARGEKQ